MKQHHPQHMKRSPVYSEGHRIIVKPEWRLKAKLLMERRFGKAEGYRFENLGPALIKVTDAETGQWLKLDFGGFHNVKVIEESSS